MSLTNPSRYRKFIDNLDQPIYFQITETHLDLNLPGDKISIEYSFKNLIYVVNRDHLKNAYANQLRQSISKNSFADDKKRLDEIVKEK